VQSKFIRKTAFVLCLLLFPTFLVASDLETWKEKALTSVSKYGLQKIRSKDLDGLNSIEIAIDEQKKPIAVIKKGDRASCEAFIYQFAEEIGLHGCVAPSVFVEDFEGEGPALLERFIRVEDEFPISSAKKPLQDYLRRHVDKRGALTVLRANVRKESEEDLKVLVSHISRASVEKVFRLYVYTGAWDALPRNTLLRLNKDGLLDLVITDTNLSFKSYMYPTCTALQIPQAKYPFSQQSIKWTNSLDSSKLDNTYGKRIELLFGKKARINFSNRGKHFQSAVKSFPQLSLRDLTKSSFFYCPLSGRKATLGRKVIEGLAFGAFDQLLKSEAAVEFADSEYNSCEASPTIFEESDEKMIFNSLQEVISNYLPYMSEEQKQKFRNVLMSVNSTPKMRHSS